MGIVVTLGMLAALVLLLANMKGVILKPALTKLLAMFVLLCGVWNAAWYGVQHLQQFWGQVALSSGLAMIIAVWIVLTKRLSKPITYVITALLTAFFLLYLITIVQINLGLPIIN